MPQQVEEEGENYRIEWDSQLNAAIFTWTDFVSGEDFQEGANACLEYARKNDFSKIIVDSSGIQAHDDEDTEWLREEWVPAMLDEGVTEFATVHKDSVISEMDVEGMMEELKSLPHDTYVTKDMEDARDWIANQ